MPETQSDLVDVECRLLETRDDSIRVSTEDTLKGGCFLPRSLVEVEMKGPTLAVVTMPQWLAEDRGLV